MLATIRDYELFRLLRNALSMGLNIFQRVFDCVLE